MHLDPDKSVPRGVAARLKRLIRKTGLASAGLLLAGCSPVQHFVERPSMLEPKGPVAGQVTWLSWIFFGLGTAIFIAVMVYLGLALFRKRDEPADEREERILRRPVIWGTILTVVILIILFGLSLNVMRALAEPETDLVIDVIGFQWWWDVRYTEQEFATANEVHIYQ